MDTIHYGRDRARRLAIEDALVAHGQIPSFVDWKALQAAAAVV